MIPRHPNLPGPTRVAPGLVLLAVVWTGGCEPPDRPPTLPGDLPPAAVRYLDPDRLSTFQIEEGVIYRAVRSGSEPWSVHLLEVDLERCELGFQVARPAADGEREPVSELARAVDPGVLAAVNGDFFTPEGRPVGTEVSAGEVRGRASRPGFAWRPGTVPWLGGLGWDGDSIRIGGWAAPGDAPGPELQVVSGFPALLQDGRVVGDLQVGERPGFAARRHPRTAVAIDPDERRLWIVVVDGRREGVSEGMTLPELAELLLALGARTAINLDGGGSSVMVVRGHPVSRPSDPSGERPVANALVVRRDPRLCSPERRVEAGWAPSPNRPPPPDSAPAP